MKTPSSRPVDISPSILNVPCEICDFGSARPESSQMTGYVSTRYYRAPEVMVSWQKYDVAIDVWSVGCVFAEMIQGQPLFAGRNREPLELVPRSQPIDIIIFRLDIQQLTLILDLLGTPTDDVIERVCNRDVSTSRTDTRPRRVEQRRLGRASNFCKACRDGRTWISLKCF